MFIVTKEIDAENIGKLCRTCLREDGEKMVCLFSGPAGSSLAAKLRTLSCLEVWQGDGLPEKLCDRCVTRAESALLYREQCRAADLALRQAASKVLDTSVLIPKVYSHQKHDYALIESPAKAVKCTECAAVFSNYGELDIHARGHMPFVRETRPVQHMNIVECQNTMGYITGTENDIVKTSTVLENTFVPSSIVENVGSAKNDRASCALHYALCNHEFAGRAHLINHHLPMHCHNEAENSCDDESSIVTDDSKILTLEDRNFSRSIDHRSVENSVIENLSYPRANETTIEVPNYSSHVALENSNIVDDEETRRGANTRNRVPSDLSNESCGNRIPRFPNFNEVEIHENVYGVFKNPPVTKMPKCFKKSHRCNVCDKLFSQRSKLLSHSLSHTGEKPFACSICDRAYTSRSKLNAHNRLHTQTNVHRCNICDKAFPYPSYLAEHSKIHETAKNRSRSGDYECTVCNKRYHLLKNLKIHLRSHTGKGLVRCEICQKAFGKKYNLKVHLRTHGAIAKLFKCIYCGKSFATKGNYIEHLRTHTRVKPFECRVCNKSFSQSSHLKTHETSHNPSRPHQCRLCGKRYKLAAHLRRHTSTHANVKVHKCDQCDQMFSQAFSLKRHLKRHSEAQV